MSNGPSSQEDRPDPMLAITRSSLEFRIDPYGLVCVKEPTTVKADAVPITQGACGP